MIERLLNKWIDFVRDHIYVITIMISISLTGLLFVQYNLIKLEVNIQKRQFDKEIDEVLLDMHHRIEDDEEISNKLIQLIGDKVPVFERDSLEEYMVYEIRTFTDSILRNHELGFLDYDFAFYHRVEDTIAFTSAVNPHQPDYQKYAFKAGWRIREVYGKGVFRFGLLFHNQSLYVVYQIFSILIITTLFILILLGSFFSTFMVLHRQKQLSQLKNDFINNLTHELKTPIFASSILYKIIKEKRHKLSEGELDHHLFLLEKENHLLKIKVEKVLELSVLEHENPGLNLKEIDLHAIIAQKAEIYSIIIHERDGVLNCNLQAENFLIQGDYMHIGNIIDNLLDNAIKYSDKIPEIQITTHNHTDGIQLIISDHGIGVESTDLPFIFDKFFRVSQGNLHQTRGFGLGLSYVKMMTELHGGTLTFESKIGKGSTVTLQFPLKITSNSIRYVAKNFIS
ncbi:sensor histidine kinase [Algoriphagus persicinus]|uniref:sensor histidine kinase n=1 Tax=Algoriphagus persicinus TaxID=3108754 RepID=UPI002B3D4D61|nr:HAMP domain-containing sensor histidine kinase [Algoriphagus sp. E1-3-M2]MEB2785240.1 HAMP domain-containing sensor histidine kinase [Algoriphagus sp. E1-3-M2]